MKDEEAVLLDNHSFLNLINVLEKQLSALSQQTGNAALKAYRDFCLDILIDLSSTDFPDKLPFIEEQFGELGTILKDLLKQHPDESESIEVIIEILEVARTRIQEFRTDRYSWKFTPCDDIQRILTQFLGATEKVSHGRFHFVYTPKKAGPHDYEIDFKIESTRRQLLCPSILKDTMRDLVGNARKYSPPGKRITIRLSELSESGLRLRVSDEGMGIPESEIEKVVRYGYRASNALDRKTMGGGFGLTKAYLLCKRFDGAFHIESQEGKGTTVELTLFPPT